MNSPCLLFAALMFASCDWVTDKSDSDGDSATGEGDDTGDVGDICDETPDPPEIEGPDCVTSTLSCGETVVGTTEGGYSQLDGAAYQTWFCGIATSSDYAGPERVYLFSHPGGSANVELTLESPCDDLDLVVVRWEADDCPAGDNSVLECDLDQTSGTSTLTVWQDSESQYYAIVDGLDGNESPYSLSLTCP